jgi:hypothetical protein
LVARNGYEDVVVSLEEEMLDILEREKRKNHKRRHLETTPETI